MISHDINFWINKFFELLMGIGNDLGFLLEVSKLHGSPTIVPSNTQGLGTAIEKRPSLGPSLCLGDSVAGEKLAAGSLEPGSGFFSRVR